MLRLGSEETPCGGNARKTRFNNKSEDEIINGCHIMGGGALLEAGLVFVQGHIAGIMQTIFNPPVGAQHVQEVGR